MEQTRERILTATIALHAEKGIATTTAKDIAARADVSVGTVYYHFPSYEDVVRACGEKMPAITQPPKPDIFTGLRGFRRRVERLVNELFAYYERYPSFERGRCDRDKLPVLAEGVARREQLLESVVRAALCPYDREPMVSSAVAMTDFAVYRALTSRGMSTAAAAAQVVDMLVPWLDKARRKNSH